MERGGEDEACSSRYNQYVAEPVEDQLRRQVEIYSDVDSPSDDDFPSTSSSKSHKRKKEKKHRESRYDKKKRRKERKRHRRRSRSRSESESSDYSRSRSRSWSRGRSRRHRHKSYDYEYDSYDSYDSRENEYHSDGYYERDDRSNNDSYKYQEPNSTVMVRGLAPHITEHDIRQDILNCSLHVKDIRLIRNRDTGISREFAFVEFACVQEAQQWMELKKGTLVFQGTYEASLIYSVPKVPYCDRGTRPLLNDWFCTACQGHNFKRRELCYKCHAPRPEEYDLEPTDDISIHPTSTIILGNLDNLTTEESVLTAFQGCPGLSGIPIRSVRIPRETLTNLSKGVCYVETNNVADAVRLHSELASERLAIDEREVSVAYSKPVPFSSSGNSSVAATALAAAQWTNSTSAPTAPLPPSDPRDVEKMAAYSAALYAKTPEEHASYLTYYRDYYKKKNEEEVGVPSRSISGVEGESALGPANNSGSGKPKRPPSNPAPGGIERGNRYMKDDRSGYYYDPVTQLHYDPTTRYFFDSKTSSYLYWDMNTKAYVQVSQTEESKPPSGKSEKEPKDKVKVAKKIAKEMEKWAKTLNQRKMVSEDFSTAPPLGPQQPPRFTEINQAPSTSTVNPIPLVSYEAVIAPGGDDSSDESDFRPNEDDKIVDHTKLACLLCKRQFPNGDVLHKHMQLSELHKKNLEAHQRKALESSIEPYSRATALFNKNALSSYRDRAKERRLKFGSDSLEAKNSLKDLYLQTKNDLNASVVEEPTKDGIRDDNIGNRMLQRMGWQEGQGLGRGNQGSVELIRAEPRAKHAGLGISRLGPVVTDEDDRYSRARKLTLARYQELDS